MTRYLTRWYWWEFQYLISPSIFNIFQLFFAQRIAPARDLSIALLFEAKFHRRETRTPVYMSWSAYLNIGNRLHYDEMLVFFKIYIFEKLKLWLESSQRGASFKPIKSDFGAKKRADYFLYGQITRFALFWSKIISPRFWILFQEPITFPPYKIFNFF